MALLAAGMALGAHAASAQSMQSRLGASMSPLGTDLQMTDTVLPVATKGHALGRIPMTWFWREVSPAATGAGGARWPSVLSVIERARDDGRLIFGSSVTASRIVQTHRHVLETEARRRRLSLPLLVAVIAVESNGQLTARSPKGAQGLMQLMPATALRFGVRDAYKPAQNIRAGAQYLDWLLARYGDDAVLALAGYNAGEGAVDRYGGVPPYRETRDYVAKVAGAYAAARRLCQTPPADARAPCVLR